MNAFVSIALAICGLLALAYLLHRLGDWLWRHLFGPDDPRDY